MGDYRSDSIPNIRTIKALRGESLRIDLGKTFAGTLQSWMKKDPNDLEYRSFEIEDERYLILSKINASDWSVGGEVVSAVGGKWYFDVEQDELEDGIAKTIFRGTIMFYNDITGSAGSEGVPPPDGSYRTVDIKIVDASVESISGNAVTQKDANTEFVTEIKDIKTSLNLSSAYKFEGEVGEDPAQGFLSFNTDKFTTTTTVKMFKLDASGFDNSYFIQSLAADDFLTFIAEVGTDVVAFKVSAVATLSGNIYSIPVVIEASVGTIFSDQANLSIDGLNKGASANLTEAVEVIGVGVVGAVEDGDIFVQGTSFTDTLKKIMQKQIPAVYYQPVAGLVINPSSTQEIGAVTNVTLTPTFTQNDAGSLNQVVFKKGGVVIQTQSDLTPFVHSTQTVQAGTNEYSVEVSYDQGPIKDDNYGDESPIGRIEAGTKTNSKSFIGSYRNWFGPNGSTEPATGAEVRNLGYSYLNSFTLNTGSVDTVHVIAVPSTKNLTSVIDIDALNANLTASYILSGTLNTVPDGGGNSISYKVYILTLGVAYSSSHRHNIIIS